MDETFQVTLDNCHLEPIHIPGSIQPHGYLLELDPGTLTIRGLSENLADRLGLAPRELLGATLASVLGGEFQARLADLRPFANLEEINPLKAGIGKPGEEPLECECIVSRSGDSLLLDLEPSDGSLVEKFEILYQQVRRFLTTLANHDSLQDIHERAVGEVRLITGFDRVMLYRFDEENNGQVVAEARREDLNSFLHQHFPESDIPAQARALYLKNPLRLLADVDAEPAPLISLSEPVDLGSSTLRSVSPIHRQYLRNMGVSASMSISIVVRGRLWGLVACHHYSPHVVPFRTREAALYLGVMLSHLIEVKSHAMEAIRNAGFMVTIAHLSEKMSEEVFFLDALRNEHRALLDLVHADGVAWRFEDVVESFGVAPDGETIGRIVEWVRSRCTPAMDYFQTHTLSIDNPEFADISEDVSGIVVLPLSPTFDSYMIWFRKEVIHTKNWGGKPEKTIEFLDDGSHRLMPRTSFKLWRESVKNKSLPWQESEIDSLLKFRNTLLNYVLQKSERLKKINATLEDKVRERTAQLEAEVHSRMEAEQELQVALDASEASNRELELFAYVASHDLQEPLRKIQAFGDWVEKELPDDADRKLKDYVGRMIGSARKMQVLIQDLLSFSRIATRPDEPELCDVNALVESVISDMQISIREKDARIDVGELGTVLADQRQIARVFQNLLQNCLKFASPDSRCEIRIGKTGEKEGYACFEISDNGIGFDMAYKDRVFKLFERLPNTGGVQGTGLGLAICRKVIERHSGSIDVYSEPGRGTTFFFTVPLAGAGEG